MARKFYVVWAGRRTGIFTSWAETNRQVDGFSQAKFKSFKTRPEAEAAFAAGSSRNQKAAIKKTKRITKKPRSKASRNSPIGSDTFSASTEHFDILVFCDGACEPNPGEAGSGISVYRDGILSELWYGLYNDRGTNNSAELNALYQALLIAKECVNSGEDVAVLSDSQYSINCITDWAFSWQKKGWKRKKTGDIKNLEIIQLAHEVYVSIRGDVAVLHVSAHVGIEGNELADRMAVFGIDQRIPDLCRYTETIDVQEILAFRSG